MRRLAHAHIAGGHLQKCPSFFYGHDERMYRSTGQGFAQTMYSRQLLGGGLLLAKTCM
ncbi:hypothetical protein [Lysinibacillus capsici]|uniref:hypothetical protein n=1 Tax=Lysinibacillus capsici TaxID=2115968 RepID=UPI0021A84F2F|nr:hypothetical protein [Lysinibacillus capsici]MCT1724511.1 hypothetical protein [Lysinibacillus capsici]